MDGFDLIPSLVPNMYDYRFQGLAALADIRKSGMYQAVQYVAPVSLQSLAALSTYTCTLTMKENTIIYGFLSFSADGAVLPFTFKVYEKPGQPIVSEYVRPSFGRDYMMMGTPSGGSSCDRTGLRFQLLTQPAPIINGKITVEISNPNNEVALPMVLLICAEPVSGLGDLANRLCP